MLRYWLVLAVSVCASVTDLRWRRVPNLLVAAGLAAALAVAAAGGCLFGSLVRMALTAAAGLALWRLRMLGAGDVKLAAFMAAALKLEEFLICVFCGLIVGAVMSAVTMLVHGSFAARMSYFVSWLKRCAAQGSVQPYMESAQYGPANTIPFSAALAAGCAVGLLVLRIIRGGV